MSVTRSCVATLLCLLHCLHAACAPLILLRMSCARCRRSNKPNLLSFNSRITFVGVGFVKLQRPLPYNVSTAWSPSLHNFDRESHR